MKEIYEMMLLFSVICLAFGNSLPIRCQPNEKKEEGEDNEIGEQVNKKIGNTYYKGDRQFEGRRYDIVVIPCKKDDAFESELRMFRDYFGTKEKAKHSLQFLAKFFVLIHILASYFLGRDGEVPEVLFFMGILSLYLKFLF